MSSFRLILKNLTAIFASNVISVLTTLVQPGIFYRAYGTTLYADWIVLSSAVSYLSTLNFGMQTFVNQDLAMRHARGEVDGFHVRQSSALRTLIAIALMGATGCLVFFVIPIEKILNLSLSHLAAATTLYFIALQVLLGALVFSYFAGAFMGVGLAHRGNYWNNAQRLANAVALCTLASLREPLYVLAISQVLVYAVMLSALLVDLKRKAAPIFPTLKYWDRASVVSMLRPSVYFGVLVWANFFGFEAPLILLRKLAGPGPVVVFLLGRQLFSFGRQILTGLSQSMGPEITLNYGQRNWERLYKLYDYSERVIFALIASINIPIFVFSPLLFALWLHKSGLYDPTTFLMLGMTAAIICVKEHKNQFQYSTNTHESQAKLMLGGYLAMTAVAVVSIHWFGLAGMAATWLATEIFLAWAIVRLNQKLFAEYERLSVAYVGRLALLASAGFAVAYALIRHGMSVRWGIGAQVGTGIVLSAGVIGGAWYAFGISKLWEYLKPKVLGKFRRPVPLAS